PWHAPPKRQRWRRENFVGKKLAYGLRGHDNNWQKRGESVACHAGDRSLTVERQVAAPFAAAFGAATVRERGNWRLAGGPRLPRPIQPPAWPAPRRAGWGPASLRTRARPLCPTHR